MSCFPFFTDYKLISSNYLDEDLMTPALSNYLLLLMKYVSFDDELEVTGVFLNVSKAFDKVWHERLLHGLNGISRNLLNFLGDFLYCRKQRVVLNGKHSSWEIAITQEFCKALF